ncbi:MAG: type II/IV secretion system protein [Gemmataceae bacterium]|nr:type II/IV secretion system protein [Gemmataceae bacterium]
MVSEVHLSSPLDPGIAAGPERICQMVNRVFQEGIRLGATDIHIEPTHSSLRVNFRLDGVLHEAGALPRELAPNLITRLKVMADLLSYRQDIPQEGRVRSDFSPADMEIRVSTFPTIHGERAAIRLFRFDSRRIDLEELGLQGEIHATLAKAIQQRTGAILLTGPGGSGKTTTIYGCLANILKKENGARHVVTLEDPVEQVLEGAGQTQVRPGTEFDFSRGLRSLLRQDPEVIMVGEIRDSETARAAIEAALSGHLLFSTLHAGSACGVVARLLDMGIEPYLLTSAIRLVLNQRLLRQSCQRCLGLGCDNCHQTGYSGRMLLAEALEITPSIRQAILRKADRIELEELFRAQGGFPLEDHARAAVAKKLTTQEEVNRVLGLLNWQDDSGIKKKEAK